jgi:hypothetical protein
MFKGAILAELTRLRGILEADGSDRIMLESGRRDYMDGIKRRIAQLDRKIAAIKGA